MLNQLEDMEDPARADELAGRLESTMFDIWPEIPDRLLWKREVKMKVVNSAQVNYRQYQSARPGPKEPGIGGLYLAGDGLCAMGGGGDLAVTSANLCADTILEDHAEGESE